MNAFQTMCLTLTTQWFVNFAGFLPLLLLSTGYANEPETKLELGLSTTKPEVFQRVEITVSGLPEVANPFDPDVATLELEANSPSGNKLRVPGFYYRDFERKLEGKLEKLTPQGEGQWRIRWLPLESGRHTLKVNAKFGDKPTMQGEAVIEVVPGKRPGLVRVEPEGRHYFRLEDGSPLFLNGLCACWHGNRGTYDYDDWLAAYQKAGINYIRIWMWHHAFGIEWDRQDKTQYHSYNEKHPARMTAEKTKRFFEKYQKPFFVSEYGTDWKGWKPDTDPHLRALHQAIWSGAFTGAAGTGMTWWWESIHTANLYRHWSALAAFLQGTGMGRADLQPARFENTDSPVTPFGVAAKDEALVWLLDRACDWPEGAMNANPAPVTGAKVALTGVADGAWSIEWWDTLAGKLMASSEATASNGALQLEPPAFQADIAARLKHR